MTPSSKSKANPHKAGAANAGGAPRPKDPFSAFPEPLREKVRQAFTGAADILAKGERIQAHWLIGRLDAEDGGVVLPVDVRSPHAKEMSAQLARQVAAMEKADFIINMAESWGLSTADSPKYEEILHKWGSVSAYPHKIDVLHVHVETYEGMYSVMAHILPKPPSKMKRRLGEPSVLRTDHVEGRLTHLLPAPEGKPLH